MYGCLLFIDCYTDNLTRMFHMKHFSQICMSYIVDSCRKRTKTTFFCETFSFLHAVFGVFHRKNDKNVSHETLFAQNMFLIVFV